jgi:SAM-dependent methyltransferase
MNIQKLLEHAREIPTIGRDVGTATASSIYAHRHGLMGLDWARFGRSLAYRAAPTMPRSALALWLTPVNCFRYFEFDFVARNMPSNFRKLLDVSSPRLFPLRVARDNPGSEVFALNPDKGDLEYTAKLAAVLRLGNLVTLPIVVEELPDSSELFDVVTSISVVEHIAGDTGDSDAIASLYSRVRPGGRLLLTVPVDREFRLEYRSAAPYEAPTDEKDGMYFFSRIYDESTIRSRILTQCPGASVELQWYGERRAGLWRSYEENWLRNGTRTTIDDARMMARDYRIWPDFSSMPGEGACGIAITRPL